MTIKVEPGDYVMIRKPKKGITDTIMWITFRDNPDDNMDRLEHQWMTVERPKPDNPDIFTTNEARTVDGRPWLFHVKWIIRHNGRLCIPDDVTLEEMMVLALEGEDD